MLSAPNALSLVWVRGKDAISFLDALLSQAVAGAADGEVRPSLLLTPQGKMRARLWILAVTDEEVGLVTQGTTPEIVFGDLTRFRFRVDAELAVEDRPQTTLAGDGASEILAAAGAPDPGTGWIRSGDGLVAAIPFAAGADRYLIVGQAADAIEQLAAPNESGYESLRISHGEPLGAVDFDDGTIAHELGPVDSMVDFTKGCYLGQELIARIDSRGRVNRHLRKVIGENPIAVPAELWQGEVAVGSVTSMARGLEKAGHVGLALVRREVEIGSEVEVRPQTGPPTPFTVAAVSD